MIVDTSALLAYFDAAEPRHSDVADALDAATGSLVVSPFVLAELDYLLATRHGALAEHLALDELAGGAWELAQIDVALLRRAASVVTRYADLRIGLADASSLVLAEVYGTPEIATLDVRHFSVLRFTDGTAPHVLP